MTCVYRSSYEIYGKMAADSQQNYNKFSPISYVWIKQSCTTAYNAGLITGNMGEYKLVHIHGTVVRDFQQSL